MASQVRYLEKEWRVWKRRQALRRREFFTKEGIYAGGAEAICSERNLSTSLSRQVPADADAEARGLETQRRDYAGNRAKRVGPKNNPHMLLNGRRLATRRE